MPALDNSTNRRQRLIRLIHVAKRDLRMDDDVYRAILQRIAGKPSAADLSVPELEKVLAHMKRCGFTVRSKSRPAPAKAPPSRPLAHDPHSRKIRALWLFLHQLGAVKNPSEQALAAYVKRLTGIDALQWIDSEQAEKLIESMKKWAMRFLPKAIEELAKAAAALNLSDRQRAELDTVLGRAYQRGTFDPMQHAWECLNEVIQKAGRSCNTEVP